MIVASRVERALSKDEILELYLNSVYLGRSAWGIELAARGYFGKPAKALDARGGRAARRPDQGAELLQSRPPSRAGAGAARLCAEPPAGGRRGHSASSRRGACRRCRPWWPTSGRAATSASISSIRSRARPSRWPASTPSPPIPTRCAPPSIRNCSGRSRAHCRKGCARYERSAGRVQFRGAEANLAQAIQRIEAATSESRRQAAGLAAGARECAAAALRRALDAGRGGGEADRQEGRGLARRPRRRAHPAARDRQCHRAAQARAPRRGLRPRDRGQGASRRARRVARAAGGAGNGGGSGEQDRPHPGHDRRLLLSAEPAQPRHPGRAPARLRHQAADLSRGARQGPAAQHAGQRRSDHAAADRAAAAPASRTTGRRRTTTAAAAAR